jgi:hypothetical protein
MRGVEGRRSEGEAGDEEEVAGVEAREGSGDAEAGAEDARSSVDDGERECEGSRVGAGAGPLPCSASVTACLRRAVMSISRNTSAWRSPVAALSDARDAAAVPVAMPVDRMLKYAACVRVFTAVFAVMLCISRPKSGTSRGCSSPSSSPRALLRPLRACARVW